jgi:tetratricopeptide (TPR) repeat protein
MTVETAEEALDMGARLEEVGELEAALKAFERALALAPASMAAIRSIPLLQHRLGLIEKAIVSYKRYLERDPLGVNFVINLANMLMQQGDVEGAWTTKINYFNAGGRDASAVANAAYLAENLGRPDIARSIAFSIMDRVPNDLIILTACADIAGLAGDPAAAIRLAGQIDRLDPTSRLASKRVNIPNYR